MKLVLLCIAFFSVHASTIPGAGADGKPYTICGGKRGHTEQDSLEAARHLEEKVILSDQHPLPINECAFAHVNNTLVSVCNGREHNRTVSRGEVRHGINALIDDCGLQGGFTGIHVAGDLTFSAYGITGAKRAFSKSVRPGPSTEARTAQSPDEVARSRLQKRECKWAYDGTPHTDCDWKNRIDAGTGKCTGTFDPANDCQVFCELRRTGLYGPESRPGGAAKERSGPTDTAVLEKGTEYSVTQGFSIGVEGVAKGAIGAGIGYQYSVSKTEGTTLTRQSGAKPNEIHWSRWVFFPMMIESCGTVGRKTYRPPAPCTSDICARQIDTGCVGDIENIENVCTMVPNLSSEGVPLVDWSLRFELESGEPAPIADQPESYKTICRNPDKGDADNRDDDRECMNHIQPRNYMYEQ